MALSVGSKWFPRILLLILCIGLHGLGLLARFGAKNSTSVSILVSGPCMLYRNFYCIFSCYLPSTMPGLMYPYICSYTDMDCPVTEIDLSKRSKRVDVSHLPEDRNRTRFRNLLFSGF
jgi:hypothetical protein